MAQSERISIGPGKAVYPRLMKPDTKFDELGAYKADLSIPLADAEPIMKKLQAVHKTHTGKAAKASENTMWYLETDSEGEETGNVVFKIRVKNRMTKKGELWDRRPKQFDAALKPIDVNPWGGSTMVVSAEIYPWDTGSKKGVSLQPVGVQILDLVTGDGASGESMGFGVQDGYTSPDDGSGDFSDKSEGADDVDDDIDDGDY